MNKRIFSLFIPLFLLFFLGYRFVGNWDSLKKYELLINWPLLVFSLLILNLVIISQGSIWKVILEKVSLMSLNYKTCLEIHIWSWMLRYIPGKIGPFLGKLYLGNKKFRIPQKKLAVASIYEYTSLILSSMIVGGYALLNTNSLKDFRIYLLLLATFLFIFVLIILPKNFHRIFELLLRIFKKNHGQEVKNISTKKILSIIPFYILNRIMLGMAFFMMVSSVTEIKIENIFFISSSYVLATILGLLTAITPNGLGVREGILTLLLTGIMPLESAIILSIVSRIWSTVGDLLLIPILLILRRK